jgi:hypothetical protein
VTAPLFIWRSRLESGAVSVFARCWRWISLRFQRPQANVLSNGRLGVRPGPGYSEASCSGRGSWRATTSPRLSQRVMDGCGSLATMARNSLRAIARRRSATELGVLEILMSPSGCWETGALSAFDTRDVKSGFHSPGFRHANVTAITGVGLGWGMVFEVRPRTGDTPGPTMVADLPHLRLYLSRTYAPWRISFWLAKPLEVWLPFLDTYRTMCVAPEPPFRAVLEEIRAWS